LSPGLTPSPCTPPQRGRRCRPAGPRRHRRRPRGAAVPRRPERRRAILRRALRKRADPSAVSRIWRAFALKPHQVESFKLSPDPQVIDKVRDVVGLYLNPPEAAVETSSPRSRTWIGNWNDDPKPYIWHKTADEILDSLAAYCQRINDSGR
jgi:hypothetical protein